MLFSVNAKIHHMKYEEKDGTFEFVGLVEAENLNQAQQKFKSYWDKKGKDTHTYYTAIDVVFDKPNIIT